MTVKLLLLLYAVLLCPGEALLGPKEIPSGNKSQKSICGDMDSCFNSYLNFMYNEFVPWTEEMGYYQYSYPALSPRTEDISGGLISGQCIYENVSMRGIWEEVAPDGLFYSNVPSGTFSFRWTTRYEDAYNIIGQYTVVNGSVIGTPIDPTPKKSFGAWCSFYTAYNLYFGFMVNPEDGYIVVTNATYDISYGDPTRLYACLPDSQFENLFPEDNPFYAELLLRLTSHVKNLMDGGLPSIPTVLIEFFRYALTMTTTDTLPEINILLLGETGVGKSTWLNSFLNYITHPSLSIAKSSEPLLHLIPTMFTITTPDFQEVVVQVGDPSLAENLKTGESATQAAQIHSFRTPSNIINFIDTPGIGDSRGIIKDGENMESVMAVIKPLGKLHGICILLKPNEARLTLSFRFCIQELLGHLHKEAVSNIVFCFTNTRGNFYRPGESIKSLKQLVSNNLPGRSSASLGLDSGSIFCFDSEAFRYLAAYKQQQDNKDSEPLFSEDESASFEQSWKKSSAEAERMIAQIMSLTPHNLDLTLDLFRLRRYVDAITIPVVELKQKLQLEIHNLEKSREDVQQQQDATTAMVSDLFKEATILKREKLNHLNIVCTHDDCSAPHGENERHFMKICHENCTCLTTGADLNIQNQAKLLQCKELSSGSTCKVCGHPWQIHMAVDYGTKMVAEQQFNSAGAADLLVNFGKTVWKRSESDGIQRRVNELKKELQTIQDATSSLVSMLQANAVDDENDAVEEYMERLIKDVKPGDEHDALEELRDSYAIKKEAFSSVENDNDCKLDMQKVDALLDSLLSLKLSGDCLRQKVNPISEKVGGKIWQRKRCEGDDKDKCNIC